MFEKNMSLALLLDIYGDVLDEHTRNILKAYYEDDLSLSEIADCEGISRQGVRHVIKKGEEQLSFMESKLCLAAKYESLAEAARTLGEIKQKLEALGAEEHAEDIEKLDRVITTILDKGL